MPCTFMCFFENAHEIARLFGVILSHKSQRRSSHYAVTHARNTNSKIQWGKNGFPYQKELLLKKRIRSLWEQILSFKRSSYFEKGRN